MHHLLERLFDAVVVIDEDGRIRGFPASAEAVFGRPPATMLGTSFEGLVPHFSPGDAPQDRWRTHAVAGDERLLPVEIAFVDGDAPGETVVLIRDLSAYEQGSVGEGWWEFDVQADRLMWSPRAYELHSLPTEVPVDREIVLEVIEPADRDAVQAFMAAAVAGGPPGTIEYRVIGTTDARILEVSAQGDGASPDGTVQRVHGAVRDVTAERLTRERLRLHEAVANALDDWAQGKSETRGLLQRLFLAMEWSLAVLWVPEEDRLCCRGFVAETGLEVEHFQTVSDAHQPALDGSTLCGRAWTTQRAQSVLDLDGMDGTRAAAARDDGLRSAVAVPIRHRSKVLAVLEFFAPDRRDLSPEMLDTLTGIGAQLGAVVSGHRGLLAPPVLTSREREVLALAAEGLGVKEVAERLVLSPATVKTHFQHVYAKLGVSDRPAAVAVALRTGVID